MSKITLSQVADITQSTSAQTTINTNTTTIQTAFDNTLSRDGTSPNQMGATLDMNGNQIINLPAPTSANSPLRFQDVDTLNGGGTIVTLPVGGTTGQALEKNSNTNYDVGWKTPLSSVGLVMPAEFTVSNSPVTSTGNLTAAWAASPTGSGGIVKATSPTITSASLLSPTLQNAALTGTLTLPNPLSIGGNTLTFPALTDTVVSRTSTDTLTNKTLTAPVISTITNTGTITLPTSSDTLVGRATTDTLTNKSISGSTNTLSNVGFSSLSITQAQGMSFAPGLLLVGFKTGVNFNSANSDNSISITLPTGFTRYGQIQFIIDNASASLTTATFGVWTAAAAGGTNVVGAGTAVTVSTSADGTNNNLQQVNETNNNFRFYTLAGFPTLFFRIGTAQGSAATADVHVFARPYK